MNLYFIVFSSKEIRKPVTSLYPYAAIAGQRGTTNARMNILLTKGISMQEDFFKSNAYSFMRLSCQRGKPT